MGEVREIYFDEVRDHVPLTGDAQRFMISAGMLAQNFPDDLAGYVMIGVDSQGKWSLSFRVRENGVMGATMLAGLAIAAIQRDMIVETQVKEALIRNGLVFPDPEQK